METTARTQTAFRFSNNLLERLKRNARKEHRSLNSYVEQTLEKALGPAFPKLPPDFTVSDEILGLMADTFVRPSPEALASDPKLASLLERYGL